MTPAGSTGCRLLPGQTPCVCSKGLEGTPAYGWGPDDTVSGGVGDLSICVIGQLPGPTPGCMSQLSGGGGRAWG